jgi:hypothetical protein
LPSTARANSTGLPIWQRTNTNAWCSTCQQMFMRSVRVIQQQTYKYSWGSQCQGLEHVSATADAAVKEHRHTTLCFSYNLKFSLPRKVSIKTWPEISLAAVQTCLWLICIPLPGSWWLQEDSLAGGPRG